MNLGALLMGGDKVEVKPTNLNQKKEGRGRRYLIRDLTPRGLTPDGLTPDPYVGEVAKATILY